MALHHEELARVLMQGSPELGMPAWVRFDRPLRVLEARTVEAVSDALRELERELAAGRWIAGFVSYEAAPAFDPALSASEPGPLPLLWFGVYRDYGEAEPPAGSGRSPAWRGTPSQSAAGYAAAVQAIKDCIARGETYQVNYTFRLDGPAPDDLAPLFAHLHAAQRSVHSAWVETPAFAVCSASPELFFRLHGNRITCQPMKGTAARGRWPGEDEAQAAALRASAKNRAENIMIVDRVRNDLGRIADTGSVTTTRIFEVQRLPTVWQMTSTVEARTRASLHAIFGALFPSASVTGAPKVHTAHLIRDLEAAPRGVYTGAVGFAGPDRRASFNVAIRTLQVDRLRRRAWYGIGSGVVWDSDAPDEYAECLAKALVLDAREPFKLLTTLRWDAGKFRLLGRHLDRLARAAHHFGFAYDAAQVRSRLDGAVAGQPCTSSARLRVTVDEQGRVDVVCDPLPAPSPAPWRVAMAAQPVDPEDRFLYFKTTERRVYEGARAARADVDDVLLWNPRGEITESTICNVAVRREGDWITPPVSCGLLAGVEREERLSRGELREGIITREELLRATEIALFNAVRGWIPAVVA